MTTISSTTAAAVQVAPSRRIAIDAGNEAKASVRGEKEVMVFRRGGTPTAEQTAQVAKHKAVAAEIMAGFEKQVREAEKLRPEIRGTYSPNIATMSLENTRKSADITQVMIDNRADKGFNETAMPRVTAGETTARSQANTTAASIYRQMQSMAGKSGIEG
jgi:hypothetical protein